MVKGRFWAGQNFNDFPELAMVFKTIDGLDVDSVEENDKEDFEWGNILKVTWDIDAHKEEYGVDAGSGEYRFDKEPEDTEVIRSGETVTEPRGGGVLKFGLQTGNDGDENVTIKIIWHDVKFYVHDLDLFYDFVDQVADIRGEGMSESAKGKVFKA